jgi:hypothetical protein
MSSTGLVSRGGEPAEGEVEAGAVVLLGGDLRKQVLHALGVAGGAAEQGESKRGVDGRSAGHGENG